MAEGSLPVVPEQHRAIIYDNPGTTSTKVVDIDTPTPGPGEVLINLYVLFSMDVIDTS
jgi:propanol-preferring alcohol dehydrogenase